MRRPLEDQSRGGSRRQFLGWVAAGNGALLAGSRVSWAAETDPRVGEILAKTITVDMHNHANFNPGARGSAAPPPGAPGGGGSENEALSVAEAMERSGTSVSCINYVLDGGLRGREPAPGEMYEKHLTFEDHLDDLLSRNKLQRALSYSDMEAAHKEGRRLVIHDAEGAEFLEEGHLDRLGAAYQRGMRKLQFVHYFANDLCDYQSGPVNHNGLSPFGAEVVKECNQLGIVVDLAHGTFDSVKGVAEASDKPFVVSHTSLFESKAQGEFWADNFAGGLPMMRARQVVPDHARVVADAGGVVGLWHLFESVEKYVEGVREMVDVVGVDHVGIGMDWAIERINEIWPDQTEGMMYAVIGEMLKQGFNPEECGKIAGSNFCRVFEACT